MSLLSTKDDIDWHTMDIETRKESKFGVLDWSDRLTHGICKRRMEYYLTTDLEDSARTTLLDFQDLFARYYRYKNMSGRSEDKEHHTTPGVTARRADHQKGCTQTRFSATDTTTMEVVCVCTCQ